MKKNIYMYIYVYIYIYIYKTESLCYRAENNITLQIKNTSIKIKI